MSSIHPVASPSSVDHSNSNSTLTNDHEQEPPLSASHSIPSISSFARAHKHRPSLTQKDMARAAVASLNNGGSYGSSGSGNRKGRDPVSTRVMQNQSMRYKNVKVKSEFSPGIYFKKYTTTKHIASIFEKIIDHPVTNILLAIFLLISLFLPDAYVLMNLSSSNDDTIDTIMLVVFISFILEFILLTITKEQYFNGFFFYMDILGTLSIILDIKWFNQSLGHDRIGDANLLRAARSAKVGAKSGRLAKLSKMFKWFEKGFLQSLFYRRKTLDPRLSQNSSSSSLSITDMTSIKTISISDINPPIKPKIPPAKAVVRALQGVLSKRVAALVMVLVLAYPIISYTPVDNSYKAHISSFAILARLEGDVMTVSDWEVTANEFKSFYGSDEMQPLQLTIQQQNGGAPLVFSFRDESGVESGAESGAYSYSGGGFVRDDQKVLLTDGLVSGVMSMKQIAYQESVANILMISVVIIVLVVSAFSFQRAVDSLIVMPLERMMETLKTSANSILKSVKAIARERGKSGVDGQEENELDKAMDDEFENILETDLLESMVAKLARITSLVLPGNENRYVNDESMDKSTKDWITNEYLDPNSKARSVSSMKLLAGTMSMSMDHIQHPDLRSGRHAISGRHGASGRHGGLSGRYGVSSSALDLANSKKLLNNHNQSSAAILNLNNNTSNSNSNNNNNNNNADVRRQSTMRNSLSTLTPRQNEQMDEIINMSEEHQERLEREITKWTFDVEGMPAVDMLVTLHYIFDTFDTLDECRVEDRVMLAFFNELESRYIKSNTYHNWYHAVDVCHTVFRIVVETQAHTFFMPLEVFAVLISALAHDVGHPGVSNAYLIKTKHELAITHNDQSPLENMHCATLYDIVGGGSTKTKTGATCNIFAGFDPEQWRAIRKIIISAILGTDMVHHFPLISKMAVFYEMNGKELINQIAEGTCNIDTAPGMQEPGNRSFLIDVFLHAADISNPAKNWTICKKWAEMVVAEFFRQGDTERKQGLDISPMCDRRTTNLGTMEIGFVEFVVFPFYDQLVRTFPTLQILLTNLCNNQSCWTDYRLKELQHTFKDQEEGVKLRERLTKIQVKTKHRLDEVAPLACAIEEKRHQYEEMLKVISSLDHVNAAYYGNDKAMEVPSHRARRKVSVVAVPEMEEIVPPLIVEGVSELGEGME